MIIDFHTHNFPDALAQRAIAAMLQRITRAIPFKPVGDGTLGRQLADMKTDGIDRAVMCPVATKPEQAEVIVRHACEIRDGACGEDAARMIVPFASLHPSDPYLLRHIDLVVNAGLRGIKLHPYYQGFALQDPLVAPFLASIRDAGLITVCHCGLDLGYVGQSIDCGPEEIAALFARVPGLDRRFVAAHLGGFSGAPPHAVDRLLDSACFIDTAVLAIDQPQGEPRRIMAEWPTDRIVFGTDYYWTSQRQLVKWVKALRPDPADREKIFHLNAERLLGLAVTARIDGQSRDEASADLNRPRPNLREGQMRDA